MKNKRTFLYFSAIHWEYIFQRPQHLALGLGRGNSLLYIDPVGTIFTCLGSKLGLTKVKNHSFRGKFVKVGPNINVYTPPRIFIPFFKSIRFVNKINSTILSLLVRKIAARLSLELKENILWVNFPTYSDLLGKLSSSTVIYDCIDDYKYFFKSETVRANIERMERDLLVGADIVFTTSEKLYNKCKSINNKTYRIPNGVNFNHFHPGQKREAVDKPAELKEIKKPLIGYIGVISWWTDLELLSVISKKLDIAIMMIGPVETDIKMFKDNENMFFLGKRDYNRLPEYIRWFDICILAMKSNELTGGVDPVKIYEYFASGKPVVCSDMEELQRFRDICFLCRSDRDFIENIKYILENRNNQDIRNRIKKGVSAALENSWDRRIESINRIINNNLK